MPTDDRDTGNDKRRRSTGAGSEAAAGIHGASSDPSTPDGSQRAQSGADRAANDSGSERSGSEPLEHDREHKGSYGGEGGAPRSSSDTREPPNPSPS